METDLPKLPDDARLSKDTVISLIHAIEAKYEEKIHYLEEQVRLFKNELFGRKSEKRPEVNPYQLPVVEVEDAHNADDILPDDDKIVIAAHSRKKKGRKSLPKELPRIDIIHDLDEEKSSVPVEPS